MGLEFRKLVADETDARVGATSQDKKWASILLYKDARVDMALLDETVGAENWNCSYLEIKSNLYCRVGIRSCIFNPNLPTNDWVEKEDCGIESQGTGEDDDNNKKGEASDAFKRACFKWGIGRELYEWKGIWVELKEDDFKTWKEKQILKTTFSVKEITYNNVGEKQSLVLIDNKGVVRYEWGKKTKAIKQAATSVKPETVNQDTPKQENAVSEPEKGIESEVITEDVVDDVFTTEELENQVKQENVKLWTTTLQNKVYEIMVSAKANKDEIQKATEQGLFRFFTEFYKLPTNGGKIVGVEISDTRDFTFIKGNTLVKLDEEFYGNLVNFIVSNFVDPF